ncbi:hypothetical protein N7540_004890 [Penicillium herquei]|nr:hypothetical protein N7540_004890 [Penicillium herquei]
MSGFSDQFVESLTEEQFEELLAMVRTNGADMATEATVPVVAETPNPPNINDLDYNMNDLGYDNMNDLGDNNINDLGNNNMNDLGYNTNDLEYTMTDEEFMEAMVNFDPSNAELLAGQDIDMLDLSEVPTALTDNQVMEALMNFDPKEVEINQNQEQAPRAPQTPNNHGAETQIVFGMPTPPTNPELEEAGAPVTPPNPPTPPTAPTSGNASERTIDSLACQKTQFSSLAEAREAMRQIDHRHNPKEDKSIPTTPEEKQVLVGKLIVALKNMDGIKDGEAAIRTFTNREFTDLDFEVTAWEILEAMITRHQFGASLTPAHAKRKTGLFKDRFVTVCHALDCSKSVAKHCLDVAYVKTFVDHPKGALDRVLGNKKVNDRKSVVLKAGKEALEN